MVTLLLVILFLVGLAAIASDSRLLILMLLFLVVGGIAWAAEDAISSRNYEELKARRGTIQMVPFAPSQH